MNVEPTPPSAVRGAAALAAAGFLLIAAFQVALASGVPWGAAAWGGSWIQLPPGMRVASGIAAAFWTAAAVVVRRHAGAGARWLSPVWARRGTWLLVVLLAVAALLNLASPSPVERAIWGPTSLLLAVLCLVVARQGRPAVRPAPPAG